MALHSLKGQPIHTGEYVDVQLDRDSVVFQGSEQEALAVYLSGNLAFRFREPTTIKHIKLHLCGVRRVSLPARTGWRKPSSEDEFYKQTWKFHDAYRPTPEVLPTGEYKFPFNVVLDGSMPESVEGLKDASITYFFTVEIGRKHAKDIRFRKPLPVIRVPQPYIRDMELNETWAEKLAYQVHVPNKVVAVGSSIDINYCFIPLLKDLMMGYVESQLLEIREFTLNEDELNCERNKSATTTIIATDRCNIDSCPAMYPIKATEGYQFSRSLRLPRTLGRCVPDTETMGISIKHKLKINVRMQNPDGHISELRLAIPVSVYQSPSYRMEGLAGEALRRQDTLSLTQDAPPAYGIHELDQVYHVQ